MFEIFKFCKKEVKKNMKIEAVSGINLTGKLLKNSGLQLSMNETVSFNNVFMAMQQMNQKQIDDSAIDRNSSKFLNLETNENSMTNGFDILNENVSQFELKNEKAEKMSAETAEKSNVQQSEKKTTAADSENKAELQEKLRQLSKERKSENVERLIAEIAELMNLSIDQLKTMLKKEGIDLSKVKAALEENDSAKSSQIMKQLALKISELSANAKKTNAEKTDNSAKQQIQSQDEGKQSVDSAKSEFEKSANTEFANIKAALKEKLNNLQRLKRAENLRDAMKAPDDNKAAANFSNNSELTDKIKNALLSNIAAGPQKLDNSNKLSTSVKSESMMKLGIDASSKLEAAQNSMPKFANNQNANSFMFNQNSGQESGSAKMSNLLRQPAMQQSSYTTTVYRQTFEQMIQQIKILSDAAVKQVEIQLRPEHLGKVKIDLLMENGSVVARFVSENEQAKQLLESNISQLKSALEEQGLKIAGFEVSVNQENQYSNRGELDSRGKRRGSGELSNSDSDEIENLENINESGTAASGASDYIDRRYSTISYIA